MVSKWRQITANLMQRTYGGSTIPPSDARMTNIQELVRRLDAVLVHSASSTGQDRRSNLEELIKRGARFGYTVFSQPTEWTFDWGGDCNAKNELVVFPALVQVGDDEGLRLRKPLKFTDHQTVVVDGR
jgi:hypothetical protein